MSRHLVRGTSHESLITVDSAGTGGWHVGEPPDPRSVATAERRGVHVGGIARQVDDADFSSFDLIVAMDRSNLRELQAMRAGDDATAELLLLREFDPEGGLDDDDLDVPDPYYGGPDGFERVFDIVHRSCLALLDHVRDGRTE